MEFPCIFLPCLSSEQAAFGDLFALLLGSTIDFFLFVVLVLFGSFHLYLLTKGMTTIEFCEKRWRRTDVQLPPVSRLKYGLGVTCAGEQRLLGDIAGRQTIDFELLLPSFAKLDKYTLC